MTSPSVLEVHTPSSSFAIVHSITQESLQSLYDKLSRKYGDRVGAGWVKYKFNGTIWDMDDDSDYTIFVWRQQQQHHTENELLSPEATNPSNAVTRPATLFLHNPAQPLPTPPADYRNPSFYLFHQPRLQPPSSSNNSSLRASHKSKKSRRSKAPDTDDDGTPKHKKEFEKFHSENGVRTVMGSIGPVQNVRMLLKSGYRHVYISRKFALEHGFIPADAAPGRYGYSGLTNIGTWPITLMPSASSESPASAVASPDSAPPIDESTKKSSKSKAAKKGPKPALMTVYLSEEPHFDVVLGRSFFEKRMIRTSAIDLTDVVCMDTGEKVECELVILKDGRGEIVTVT
ncbi:hypothetical protein D9758_000668 [Tetrapyrgos nigripes]|uniref:Uncharacterized protein n=1 Tax=Tetrapyrgos nigripes TaxID=182062 RepID=A0A8H5GZ80_9AGAR|nr:hypothetical protein D9758_000668 [Tetrapyrgos nigripes]